MNYLKRLWRESKLKAVLYVCWLFTVLTSFLGDSLISFEFPLVGVLFPFRIFLPVTFLIYIVYSLREKKFFWKENSKAEKVAFVLIAVLVVHSAIGLFYSIDFNYSFRRVFNLCLDLCLFFLMIQLCSDNKLFRMTIKLCAFGFVFLGGLGIWECTVGPVFHPTVQFQTVNLFGWEIVSPEVIYNNTNDYATSVMFLCMLLITWLLQQRKKISGKTIAFLIGLLAVTFLIIEYASGRLLSIAFWLLLILLMVYMLSIRDRRAVTAVAILAAVLLIFTFTKEFDLRSSIYNLFSLDSSQNDHTRPQIGLKDQFFEKDPETGSMQLSAEHSAGVRGLLLNHAIQCFFRSKGLGVGVGNTEKMAQILNVTQTKSVFAIHCFLARMTGDYGISFLLPILALGIIFIQYVSLQWHKKEHHRGYAIVLCGMLLVFLLTSSTPAEAQDILPMWMFLAFFIKQIKSENSHEENLVEEKNL